MIENLSKEYRLALKDFLAGGGETALENAYLLGRQALDQGIGVLDVAAVHHQVLIALLLHHGDTSSVSSDDIQIIRNAEKFLVECLSPFEMAQRGFRESITGLNKLNEKLEDEVEQRTQAMRVSEKRYRSLIEISPDAIMVTDFEGKVVLCNKQSAQLHGYSSSSELIGVHLGSFIPPEDMHHINQIAQRLLQEGGIGDLEYTLTTRNGTCIPIEARTTLVWDHEGNPVGFISINRDISERKHAQLQLEAQERKQSALAELGQRALSSIDIKTLMQEAVNLVSQTLDVEYCELLELMPEKKRLILREGVGWKTGAVGSITVPAGNNSQAGYTLQKAQPVIVENLPEENRFTPSLFFLKHNIIAGVTVIIYNKAQPYGILGAHTSQKRQFTPDDVHFLQSISNVLAMAIDNRNLLETESKARARAEAEKERALKSLAFVSHELRTPLTSIKGFASTLLASDVTWSKEQQRDFIETIDDEANKLNGFIEQLLEISKMDAGVFNFSARRQSVESLMTATKTHIESLAEQHNLVIDIANALPDIIADTQRFEQILANLVENAAKYSPPHTVICVSARANKDVVEFSVADEGPGIAAEEREKVFEPFYRSGNRTALKTKGAGLGLTICKKLIEGQNGHIWINGHSETGTSIHFTLPIAVNSKKQSK
jgi:PAS domain S-box-containing protein